MRNLSTLSDEVLSRVGERPPHKILECLYRLQLENSKELEYVMQVDSQEIGFRNQPNECEKNSSYWRNKLSGAFKARNILDEKPIPGAAANGKETEKKKVKANVTKFL